MLCNMNNSPHSQTLSLTYFSKNYSERKYLAKPYQLNNDNGSCCCVGEEAGSGQIAAIVSGIGVALLGAASSYFAYQKKKLCFKVQGGE